MGTYVTFTAKPGCADQINAAYAKEIGGNDSLVYSARVIMDEIAYIHSPAGESQAHLRPHLKTVKDWNQVFPALREDTGQIKISWIADDEMCDLLPRREHIRKSIAFLLEHRMLFARIDGLDDAREHGLTDYTEDRIENHKGCPTDRATPPTFADLPKSRFITSWVIVRKATGEAVLETYSARVAFAINKEKYRVVPILEYLEGINAEIKSANNSTK